MPKHIFNDAITYLYQRYNYYQANASHHETMISWLETIVSRLGTTVLNHDITVFQTDVYFLIWTLLMRLDARANVIKIHFRIKAYAIIRKCKEMYVSSKKVYTVVTSSYRSQLVHHRSLSKVQRWLRE